LTRFTISANYTLGWVQNNSDNAFYVPPSGRLSSEWGAASGDVRSRLFASVTNNGVKHLSTVLSFSYASAPPYTAIAGTDLNGDGLTGDRPAGVGRNTKRAASRWNVNASAVYSWSLGHRQTTTAPGVIISSSGGSTSARQVSSQAVPRYRIALSVNVQNLSNHTNVTSFAGTLTSPFFGRPTAALAMRKIDLSATLTF
jgi:hypothetical protein